jgi:hypothetical protein
VDVFKPEEEIKLETAASDFNVALALESKFDSAVTDICKKLATRYG